MSELALRRPRLSSVNTGEEIEKSKDEKTNGKVKKKKHRGRSSRSKVIPVEDASESTEAPTNISATRTYYNADQSKRSGDNMDLRRVNSSPEAPFVHSKPEATGKGSNAQGTFIDLPRERYQRQMEHLVQDMNRQIRQNEMQMSSQSTNTHNSTIPAVSNSQIDPQQLSHLSPPEALHNYPNSEVISSGRERFSTIYKGHFNRKISVSNLVDSHDGKTINVQHNLKKSHYAVTNIEEPIAENSANYGTNQETNSMTMSNCCEDLRHAPRYDKTQVITEKRSPPFSQSGDGPGRPLVNNGTHFPVKEVTMSQPLGHTRSETDAEKLHNIVKAKKKLKSHIHSSDYLGSITGNQFNLKPNKIEKPNYAPCEYQDSATEYSMAMPAEAMLNEAFYDETENYMNTINECSSRGKNPSHLPSFNVPRVAFQNANDILDAKKSLKSHCSSRKYLNENVEQHTHQSTSLRQNTRQYTPDANTQLTSVEPREESNNLNTDLAAKPRLTHQKDTAVYKNIVHSTVSSFSPINQGKHVETVYTPLTTRTTLEHTGSPLASKSSEYAEITRDAYDGSIFSQEKAVHGEHMGALGSKSTTITDDDELLKQIDDVLDDTIQETKTNESMNYSTDHFIKNGRYLFELYQSQQLTDLTVVVRKHTFHAHATVLSRHSEHIANWVKNTLKFSTPKMTLDEGVTAASFKVALRYMYTGDLNLTDENVFELLECATKLMIPEIVVRCQNILNNMSPEELLHVIQRAIQTDVQEVTLEKQFQVVADNFCTIVKSPKFLNLDITTLCALVSRDDIRIHSELEVAQAVFTWMMHDDERLQYSQKVIANIRCLLMTSHEIVYIVSKFKCLMQDFATKQAMLESLWLRTSLENSVDWPFFGKNMPRPRNCLQEGITERTPFPISSLDQNVLKSNLLFETDNTWVARFLENGEDSPYFRKPNMRMHEGTSERRSSRTSSVEQNILQNSLELKTDYKGAGRSLENDVDSLCLGTSMRGTRSCMQVESSKSGHEITPSHTHSLDQLIFQSNVQPENDQKWVKRSLEDDFHSSYLEQNMRRTRSCIQECTGERILSRKSSLDQNFMFHSDLPQQNDYNELATINSQNRHMLFEKASSSEIQPPSVANELVSPTIFLVGGYGPEPNSMHQGKIVERYDVLANCWNHFSMIPEPRFKHGVVILNDDIYIIGGSTSPPVSEQKPTNVVYKLNISTGSWETLTPMKSARMYHVTEILNDKIYAIGGESRVDEILPTVEYYDPANKLWMEAPAPHYSRIAAASALYNNKIYIAGGFGYQTGDANRNSRSVLDTMEFYDSITNSWNLVAPLPCPKINGRLAVLGDSLYSFGGLSPSGEHPFVHAMSVDVYNNNYDSWISVTTLMSPRCNPGVAVLGSKLYIMGGMNLNDVSGVDTMEQYDADTGVWTKMAPMPLCRADPQCVAYIYSRD